MKKYVIRRVLSIIPVLLIVSVVVFSIVYLIPGDPAAVILGDNATPEDIMALRTRMGLDDPPVTRYFHWLGNVFSGDLGVSVSNNTPVSEMLKSHMLPTLSLAIYAMIISVVIALPLGMVAAR
ncbi:MAG: ABC transporter permease, partial [Sphaerochaetaceae bacterium]